MPIYRLEPSAAPDDPRWDNAPTQGTVIVRAESPADARLVASEAEADFLEVDAKPGDGVSTSFASAFRNPLLYSVVEDTGTRFAAEGPRAVLEGDLTRDVLLTTRTAGGDAKG
ncbi:hypothetical protein N1F89_04050 [Aquibium sp. A9E412]|uniref:hypothetical protein n=1 Tax=Aquibium sp. A9E412 TaxID=2976767 RepID=UPI0025B0539B|nr:hypothetical protein [Aquibium sp. A9E412]MDN2565383.1 hypothetical protein [Aquibium sp. A9E412]